MLFTYRPAAFEGFEADGDVELATVEYLLDLVRRSYETDASGLSLPSEETPDIVCGVYVRPRAGDVAGGRVLAASQRHIAEQCSALKDAFEYRGISEATDPEQVDRRLSIMPWAHIIERIQAVYLGIEAGIPTYVPCSPRDLILDFGEAEPTLFSASSQMYDHLRDRLIDSMYEVVGDAVDLPQAFDALETQSAMLLFGQDVPRDLAELAGQWRDALEPVAKDLLGGSLRLLTSASRLFDADTDLFYEAIGHRIYRSYGGNWLGGLIATNTPKNWQVDTFGHEVSPYSIVADGQHLTVEGSLVWPLSETEQFHDFVGAISTADVAEIDDGWLRIFGADAAVTRQRVSLQGINLVPTTEETYLMNDPLVDQAVAVSGAMLIVPDHDALGDWAQRWGLGTGALQGDPEVIERFQLLTDLNVALQESRQVLGQEVAAADVWSHVDEIAVAISKMQSAVDAADARQQYRLKKQAASDDVDIPSKGDPKRNKEKQKRKKHKGRGRSPGQD